MVMLFPYLDHSAITIITSYNSISISQHTPRMRSTLHKLIQHRPMYMMFPPLHHP